MKRSLVVVACCFASACTETQASTDALVAEDVSLLDVSSALDVSAFDAPSSDAATPLDAASPTDAPTVDAPRRTSSGGSGGLPCTSTGMAPGGIPFCVAQVGSVEMKIVEPALSTGPMRLAIYLHGDGASAYTGTNNTAVRIQAPWARDANVLYVAALAPNRCAWWLRPTLESCTGSITDADRDLAGANADALLEAIEALRAGWDLREDATYLGGSSGGSVFLQASFIPRHGDHVPGIVALGCGGMAPWAPFAWEVTPASIGTTALFANYGDADSLVPDIEAGNLAYLDLGFPVTSTVQPGVGHCAFDHIGWVRDVWQAH